MHPLLPLALEAQRHGDVVVRSGPIAEERGAAGVALLKRDFKGGLAGREDSDAFVANIIVSCTNVEVGGVVGEEGLQALGTTISSSSEERGASASGSQVGIRPVLEEDSGWPKKQAMLGGVGPNLSWLG